MASEIVNSPGCLDLIRVLSEFEIIKFTRHRISHQFAMINSSTMRTIVKPHWIPVQVQGTYMEFIEIVGTSGCNI